ncbi:MAG: hypothetical protein PHE89_04600 [Alphaproteobacteria bacterium]|nr:hypothetical protein [Alphaproteobacteria bacterium]
MKRIIISTTQKQANEKPQLISSISHRRNCLAYLPSMGFEQNKGEAFTKEYDDNAILFREAEDVYTGIVSYYYVFAVDSFDEIEPFVESELERMAESNEYDADKVYLENLKNIQKSLQQKECYLPSMECSEKLKEVVMSGFSDGFYESSADCYSYLQNMLLHVLERKVEVASMKFNFIENN